MYCIIVLFVLHISSAFRIFFGVHIIKYFTIYTTRRYSTLRRPTSIFCGGLWPLAEAFFALWAIMLFLSILRHFLCPVVTMANSSSNLSNF